MNKRSDRDCVTIDVNELTDADWKEIEGIAEQLQEMKMLDGDPIKCVVGAFVYWATEGTSLTADPAPEGTLVN